MRRSIYSFFILFVTLNVSANIYRLEQKLIEEILQAKSQKEGIDASIGSVSLGFSVLSGLSNLLSIFISNENNKKHFEDKALLFAKLSSSLSIARLIGTWYLSAKITSKEETLAKIRTFKETSDSNDIVAFFEFTQKE